jgi:hypothetical protein
MRIRGAHPGTHHLRLRSTLTSREEAHFDNRRVRPSLTDLFGSIDGATQLFKFLDRAFPAHKPPKPPWLPGTPRVGPFADG